MYKLIRPFLFTLSPEAAHKKTLKLLRSGLLPNAPRFFDECLQSKVAGLAFENPVGLAAGFDKDAEAILGEFHLGFGFVEVGTVTPQPQQGNPAPRVFRDTKTSSIINRMGFPNGGLHVFKTNLARFRKNHKKDHPHGPVGVNIGMNKDQKNPEKDYVALINKLSSLASYFTINISSPNTPGLRDLQSKENLAPFLKTIMAARDAQERKVPVFLKLSPDLELAQIKDIAEVVLAAKIDGLILTNTTLARPEELPRRFAEEKGGLSGPFVKDKSNAVIAQFYSYTDGRIPIIGVGGISSGQDALEKILAGASLVQLYTGLVFEGPGLPKRICEDLATRLKTYGFANVADAVGAEVDEALARAAA